MGIISKIHKKLGFDNIAVGYSKQILIVFRIFPVPRLKIAKNARDEK